MKAISIHSTTIMKILEKQIDPRIDGLFLEQYSAFDSHKYILVESYINAHGEYINFTVLPRFVIFDNFDVLDHTIDTDWTDIYRKVPDSLW